MPKYGRLFVHPAIPCAVRYRRRVSSSADPAATIGGAGATASTATPSGLDPGASTANDLVLTVCGLLADPDVGGFVEDRFPARLPLAVLGALGFAPNATRMALSRLLPRNLLTRERSGRQVIYRFTDELLYLMRGSDRVRSPQPFEQSQTMWTLVTFSIPESRRELRTKLRSQLASLGFRPLQAGVWVALGAEAAEAVAHLEDGADYELDIFTATPYVSARLSDLIRRAWDLDDLRAQHVQFLDRWEHVEPSSAYPLAMLTLLATDWDRLLRTDPGLPSEHLGSEWPGTRSAATARRLFRALEQPAGRALLELLHPA